VRIEVVGPQEEPPIAVALEPVEDGTRDGFRASTNLALAKVLEGLETAQHRGRRVRGAARQTESSMIGEDRGPISVLGENFGKVLLLVEVGEYLS
jgi:hypothetical protein